MSGSGDVLFGLDKSDAPSASRADIVVQTNLCSSLFGSSPIPQRVVPIAVFSDYNCPYCRVLSGILQEVGEQYYGRVRISWHEWPTLGQSSHKMARASLAARRQGMYMEFHNTLMGTRFVPTLDYLRDLATRKGISPKVLVDDMRGPEIAWEIAISTALAGTFGFRGTPAMVVGRTAVVGAIGRSALQALIERERSDGPVPGCA